MQLHPALSFCMVENRPVFLDLDHDRYFCLGGDLAASWSAWLRGSVNPDAIDSLARRGLVVPGPMRAIEACPGAIARASLLDDPLSPVSLARMLVLAWTLSQTRWTLRRRGLGAAASALDAARRKAPRRAGDRLVLAAIARDFERLGLLASAHNQCLARSLALGLHLARSGYAPEVVLGVRLGPFRAHCWVECAGFLVNDRFERVRHYTPIRRL